jgi:S1-C subfamily serine protease
MPPTAIKSVGGIS